VTTQQLGETVPWGATVRELADRIAGIGNRLVLKQSPAGRDRTATIAAREGMLTLEATEGVSAAVGLHHYLRTICGRSVQWDTPLPLSLGSLPDTEPVSVQARVREQYYLNFCTYSYTMPYWQWDDWEREIDWMALHGITMPLSLVGHEAVLHDALCDLGMSSEGALAFLGSPTYIPFLFMGCLEGTVPSIDEPWLEERSDLGRRILERQRSFGMTPVLPAFVGHLPRELAPEAMTERDWQGHPTWVLDPAHPLFAAAGAAIARHQIARFGTDHLYASDPFIEMLPVDTTSEYARTLAQGVLGALTSVDEDAVWVLQAWPFVNQPDYWTQARVEEFVGGIAPGRLILLDLWADIEPQWKRYDGFGSANWVWCALLDFGGRTDPMGDLAGLVERAEEALTSARPPVGIGLSMEATRNNHVLSELVADLAWRSITDVESWVREFARWRHPELAADAGAPWVGLAETVYAVRGLRDHAYEGRGVLTIRPQLYRPEDATPLRVELGELVPYHSQTLLAAWEGFTRLAERAGAGTTVQLGRDLLDAATAALLRVADILCIRVLESEGTDTTSGTELLGVFDMLDAMLATHAGFRLETWETAAARAASSSRRQADFVRDARRILTTWNEEPATYLDDYACRAWQGLVGGYYRARWARWLDYAAAGFPPEQIDALERDLDELSRNAVDLGLPTASAPLSDLGRRSRATLERFAPVFATGSDTHTTRRDA
jgi:alpha-N-acetylglucosaminidase